MTKPKKMNAGNSPGKGHNSRARRPSRKEIIRGACQEITVLEGHRKATSEQIRSIKTEKIKTALGMKISDFNVALRLYQLEGADRDQLLDTVHETFEALGVGGQLDWVTASERATQAGTEKVDEGAEAAAVQRGPVGAKPKLGDEPRATA